MYKLTYQNVVVADGTRDELVAQRKQLIDKGFNALELRIEYRS
jgi:hypothetical protein